MDNKKKILIVDDDTEDLQTIDAVLKTEDMKYVPYWPKLLIKKK
jgi:hypothetical protein